MPGDKSNNLNPVVRKPNAKPPGRPKKSNKEKLTNSLTNVTAFDTARALEMRIKKGMTYQQIADLHGVTKQTVHKRLKRFTDLIADKADLDAYTNNKGHILESVELTLLNDLVDGKKRESATLNNVAYALQNVSNMTRLERGQSTSNISYQDMSASLDDLRRERKQLEETLSQ